MKGRKRSKSRSRRKENTEKEDGEMGTEDEDNQCHKPKRYRKEQKDGVGLAKVGRSSKRRTEDDSWLHKIDTPNTYILCELHNPPGQSDKK